MDREESGGLSVLLLATLASVLMSTAAGTPPYGSYIGCYNITATTQLVTEVRTVVLVQSWVYKVLHCTAWHAHETVAHFSFWVVGEAVLYLGAVLSHLLEYPIQLLTVKQTSHCPKVAVNCWAPGLRLISALVLLHRLLQWTCSPVHLGAGQTTMPWL